MSSPLRQPLASGSGALARWARLGAALPGLASVGFAVMSQRAGSVAGLAIGAAVGAVLLVPAALSPFAPGERASDLIFEPEGLRIVGGRHHGLRLAWAEIDPAGIELEETREKRATVALMAAHLVFLVMSTLAGAGPELAPSDGDPVARLWVRTRAGARHLLARGVEDDEVTSLRALHEALVDRVRPAPPADEAPPSAVRCPACAAPARPSEEPSVACAFCGGAVPMPAELRRRLAEQRALGASRGRVEALVRRLADLPSARAASFASLALLFVVMLLGLGAGVLFAVIAAADVADPFAFAVLAIAGGLLVLAAWRAGGRAVIDRQALGEIGALFGARAPRREGEAWGCRSCGAPLPAAAGPVLRCAYCDAESVPGIDSRRALSAMGRSERSLSERAEQHAARRRRAGVWAAVLGVGALLASLALAAMGAVGLELMTARSDCDRGKGRGCYRAALAHFNGTARKDRRLALDLAERSCKLGDLEGCCFVREFAKFKWGAPRDLPGAERRVGAATKATGRSPCRE